MRNCGQNQTDNSHPQVKNTIPDTPTEAIEGSVHLKTSYRF